MKAKEYYEKYANALLAEWEAEEEPSRSAEFLVKDLYLEAVEQNRKRHGTTDRALLAAIGEQNEKWNSIVRMFEKNDKISPLKWNGLLNAIRAEHPAIFAQADAHVKALKEEEEDKKKKEELKQLQAVLEKDTKWIKALKERKFKNAKFV